MSKNITMKWNAELCFDSLLFSPRVSAILFAFDFLYVCISSHSTSIESTTTFAQLNANEKEEKKIVSFVLVSSLSMNERDENGLPFVATHIEKESEKKRNMSASSSSFVIIEFKISEWISNDFSWRDVKICVYFSYIDALFIVLFPRLLRSTRVALHVYERICRSCL